MAQTPKDPTTSKQLGRGNRARQKDLAHTLFLNTNKTQDQIAEQVGVTPQTLSKWVIAGNWHLLRSARQVTRPQLVRQYLLQLNELNNIIAERPEAERIPSPAETDQMAKLAKLVESLDKETSLMDYVHVMENFLLFLARAGQVHMLTPLEPLVNEFLLTRAEVLR